MDNLMYLIGICYISDGICNFYQIYTMNIVCENEDSWVRWIPLHDTITFIKANY